MTYLTLIAAWSVYFFLHSALAADAIKNWAYKNLHISKRNYRLVYSIISTGTLAAIIYLIIQTPAPLLFKPSWPFAIIAVLCILSGTWIFNAAFRQYCLRAFIGLDEENSTELKTTGILSRVRHPLYTATILWSIAYLLLIPTTTSLTSVICIFTYLPIGIGLEERKLIKQFGEQYLNYRKRVPALIPRLK